MHLENKFMFIVLVIASGLIGGATSSYFLQGKAEAQMVDILVAKEFRVVDDTGRIRASLAYKGKQETYLQIYSATGIPVLDINTNPFYGISINSDFNGSSLILSDGLTGPRIVIWDGNNKTKWVAP